MIEKIVILSLLTIGICSTTWHDMIFEKVGSWIEDKIGVWATKPLFSCYICATFWYSLVACYILNWDLWLCLPAMGLSAVISLLQHD